ncbi:MAG TPA: prolyl oligopeptidase family serine peptidase [Candidatus Sulfotelmatobacter sp.]|nr:prolyl oligopeptidase family serine peptidase [Candidatus Sulfotelmatobacter sp.]
MNGALWVIGCLVCAMALQGGGKSKTAQKNSAAEERIEDGPPVAEPKPVIDIFHGTKVLDNYRWLEKADSPATKKWVAGENAYTRAILDRLPGRAAIEKRLTELLSIGNVTPPIIAGRYYFYTKREGMQNQPVLYVRERIENGEISQPTSLEDHAPAGADSLSQDRVLIDANKLSADGTTALDWFQPSDNGKYVAYGLSENGSEMSTLHVIETKTGEILPDTIERTRAASIAWLHDNSGFYYTRYPNRGDVPAGQEMYNRHVFFHLLGSPVVTDDPIFGEGRDPEDWPSVSLSNDGRWLVINVAEGWTKSELYLMDLKSDKPPIRLTTGKNFLYAADVYKGKVYITTNEDAPRYRVLVTDAGNFDREAWKEIIPQSDAVLQGAAVFGGKLFAQYEQNASSQLKVFDLDGKKLSDVALPGIGTVFGTSGKWNRAEMFFGFQSFTVPPSIYRVALSQGLKPASSPASDGTAESRALSQTPESNGADGNVPAKISDSGAAGPQGLKPASTAAASGTAEGRALPKTSDSDGTAGSRALPKTSDSSSESQNPHPKLANDASLGWGTPVLWNKVEAPSIDPSAYEVAQEWFQSKDGTRVPMFVVHKKGLVKNGKNPTLLTGYGGFNVSLTPSFSRTAFLWMEHGGVYAVANLRGGAEFGEDWHRAGMLDKKQNVFDDMIAAAQHLIAAKYTDRNHLAIQGGSNGGLLMGAMITQRPDLFRAVICQVPLLDMLHYQDFQIAKLWIPEYGTSEDPAQFKWLYAYSPYHHVKEGVEYPAIMFMTADTDTRVDPMHAKKMTAEMQAEARNGMSDTRPILLRIESKAGHGAGKPVSKQIEEFTDVYLFLFWQVGLKTWIG